MMTPQHYPLRDIESPHDHDVLSGRGNFVNYHAGNEYFRALVRKHKVAYVACPKPQKGKFSKMIVDEIKYRNPPGRFLKQDSKTKLWYDIGEKKALDKTRQALREGAPSIAKELTGGETADDGSSDLDVSSEGPQPQVTSSSSMKLPMTQEALSASMMNTHGAYRPDQFNLNTQTPPTTMSSLNSSLHSDNNDMGSQQQQEIQQQMLNYSMLQNNGLANMTQFGGQFISPQASLMQQNIQNPMAFQQQNHHHSNFQTMAAPSGFNFQRMQESVPCNTFSAIADQAKLYSANSFNTPYEPRPISPHQLSRPGMNESVQKPIVVTKAPLRKEPQKVRKEENDFHCSTNSLMMDNVFSGDKTVDGIKSKMHGSTGSILSIMSLDDGGDNLGKLFNSSVRLNNPKAPIKRSGSADDNSITVEGNMASVFEMSVNTLGDTISNFGDSALKMTESQADMSFGNVFDDTDHLAVGNHQ